MTLRLAISGSAGTGKSSLAAGLASYLKVPYLEENFRKRREKGLIFQDLSRLEQSLLIRDLYRDAIDQAVKCSDGFVQDRCPIDFLAFWFHYGFGVRISSQCGCLIALNRIYCTTIES